MKLLFFLFDLFVLYSAGCVASFLFLLFADSIYPIKKEIPLAEERKLYIKFVFFLSWISFFILVLFFILVRCFQFKISDYDDSCIWKDK